MATNKFPSYDNAPFLQLSHVQYSLTEGTPIPAPAEEDPATTQPTNDDDSQSADFRGPLSSHPVTPDEAPIDRQNNEFPSYNWSRDTTGNSPNGNTRPGTGSASAAYHAQAMAGTTNGTSSAEKHLSHAPDDPNNFDPALPPHQPSRDTSRRPSFVDRLFPRLRSSSSFLRSRSKSSLGQYSESTSNLSQMGLREDKDTRGVKRPASPSDAGGRPGSRGGASTFPRMVRKKSLELLGSARRKSGMWTANDRDGASKMAASAMEEERGRERLRELEEQQQNQQHYQPPLQISREPPPQIDLGRSANLGGAALDGEAMFGSIGR